ncbi:MAG: methyltransferase domain-containing protein [Deltaproteobacteria bacterium]|nr:methyltransferase domain-containing protein [Deltaproteobacteria bacterium]
MKMMNFSKYFSEQARRPSGFFGRIIMPIIFDRGNAFLNSFVYDVIGIKPDDRILEIGCGTGSLIKEMAEKLENGFIEGIDFSSQMVMIAKRKNRKHIARRAVNITVDHFDDHSFKKNIFTKACSVNTIYFWEKPSIICPFFGDQPFWGRQVERIGVGPSPIPQKRFTVERLCHAIKVVMNDSAMRQNAAALGNRLQKENGISNAVAFITQWMNDK